MRDQRRRPYCTVTRRTGRANTAAPNSPTSPAGCTPTDMPASASFTRSPEAGTPNWRYTAPPRVGEVGCWSPEYSHVRRGFHDEWTSHQSSVAKEALERIGALFDIERAIAGAPPDIRRGVRQRAARPRIDELAKWLDAQLEKLPGKSDLARAIRYARSRWTALTRFLDDGRIEICNNAAENQIRTGSSGQENLAVLRFRCWRRACGGILYADPNRETEWHRAGSVAHRCGRAHRAPSDQLPQRAAALELAANCDAQRRRPTRPTSSGMSRSLGYTLT